MRNILLFAALFLCTATRAQTGNVLMQNFSNCDAYVYLQANDPGVFGTTCDIMSNAVFVPAGGNNASPDYCSFEGFFGWQTSPGSVCPSYPSTTFQWTDARISWGTCYTSPGPYGTPYCGTPGSSGFLSSPSGNCNGFGTYWDDGIPCVKATWTESITAPYDIYIKIYK